MEARKLQPTEPEERRAVGFNDPRNHDRAREEQEKNGLSTMAKMAEIYIRKGWPVVPVDGKRPTVSWRDYQLTMPPFSRLRREGAWDAATGLALVIGPKLHERWPYLWVLDVERQHREEAEAWLDRHLPGWRESIVAESGGGGLHVYFRAHEPVPSGKTPWGDIKGDGGIVVLPPSMHASGQLYRWLTRQGDPYDLHPSHLPPKEQPKPAGRVLDNLGGKEIKEGERNYMLFRVACRLRATEMAEYSRIMQALRLVNDRFCKPPLPELELRQIAKSACRYPPGFEAKAPPKPPQASPFPVAVLPGAAGDFVSAAATALDCPPELVAMPLLALSGGVIGNRLSIELTQAWQEYPILWTVVVAPPGSAKSPAQSLALDALSQLQQGAMAAWRSDLAAWERAKKEADAGSPGEKPEPEHFYTTDSTIEALVRMLGHGESRTPGMTMVRDELVSWVRTFDAYRGGKGGERQLWMTLWSGAALKSDRAGRESYWVERPVICVTGGIQPDMLGALETEAGMRDGFLERFLFAYPEPKPMQLVDAPFPSAVAGELGAVWARLRKARAGVVRLDPEARALLKTWHAENVAAQEQVSGMLLGSYAKLPGQAGRLALVLHALAHPDDPSSVPLGQATMIAALELAEYLRAHLHRVAAHFGVAAQVQDGLAVRVLRAIERNGGSATTNDLYKALNSKASELQQTLQKLQDDGLVSKQTIHHDGPGRPGARWTLSQAAGSDLRLTMNNSNSSISSPEVYPQPAIREEGERGILKDMDTHPSLDRAQTPGEELEEFEQIQDAACDNGICRPFSASRHTP